MGSKRIVLKRSDVNPTIARRLRNLYLEALLREELRDQKLEASRFELSHCGRVARQVTNELVVYMNYANYAARPSFRLVARHAQ